MDKKITIYDVAQHADVAISTVSRVLNGSPYVSEKTREKVQQAIKKLEFRPQASARNLASKKPQVVAVAVPSFTTPYYTELLKGVKDNIPKIDLDLVIFNTGSLNPEAGLINFLDRGTADTLIIISIQITDEIHRRLKNARIPVVLVGTRHPDYDYLDVDDYLGGFIAGEHLVKQGYKRMGVIRASRNARIAEHREKGFKDALTKAGITLDEKYCLSGKSEKHAGFTEEAGFEVAKQYMAMDQKPDAVFCLNDTQAIGAMSAFSQAGINVPKDIGLIGYDNIKFSRYIGLTTIDQQMYTVGALATDKLNIRLNNSDAPLAQEVFSPKLVVRESTEKV